MKKRANLRPIGTGEEKSALHRFVLGLVKEIFPGLTIAEEQTIEADVGGRPQKLFVDIVIKEIGVCIECQGRQHNEYVKHFHQTDEGFARAKKRDQAKAKAIKACGKVLVLVDWTEQDKLTTDQLSDRILEALRS